VDVLAFGLQKVHGYVKASQRNRLDYRAIAAAFSTVAGILAGFGVTTVIFVLVNRSINAEFILMFLVTAATINIATAALFALTSGLDSNQTNVSRNMLIAGICLFTLAAILQVTGLSLTFYVIGLYKLVATSLVVGLVCLVGVVLTMRWLGLFD
jgi:hypothetical protein